MDWVQARRMRKRRDSGSEEGIGMRARKTAEGRWVKTIVCRVSMQSNLRENWKTYLDIPKTLG
jgi:hypothetical protein